MTSTAAAPATPLPIARNYLGGAFVGDADSYLDVLDPSDGSVISRVPVSSGREVDAAVRAASVAFPAWSATPIKERVQVLYRYRALLERHLEELATLITREHGKIRSEAEAEVLKAIELTEFACSMPQIVTGEILEVSRGVECRTDRHLILKPSELVPLSAVRTAELLTEAGLPPGVFNVVHGTREVVEAICDHQGIAAITFVGSTRVAKIVYRRGTASLKRVLALGGAKNHLIVLPDADLEMTSTNVVASMSGCTGQRCMAASVMVGRNHGSYRPQDGGARPHDRTGQNLAPVISREAKDRI
jgi:malonate-semialdehyde dehydrogenase (acetylating)/methylmalonate-semialdehyde dehydrogenase